MTACPSFATKSPGNALRAPIAVRVRIIGSVSSLVVAGVLLATALYAPFAAEAKALKRQKASTATTLAHQLIRRIAMFPIDAPKELAKAADDAWWEAREELTKSRRFLVASKQFLLKSEAYQPRGALEPADAILLGKLLDAHALITSRLEGRRLFMAAYDGSNGIVLWERDYPLHPSIAAQEQLASAIRKVASDFLAAFPYQAFQIVDPIVGVPVYDEGDMKVAQIEVGAGGAQVGDTAQWIRVESQSLQPLFQGGAKIDAFAEGRVIKVDQGVASVELLRIEKGRSIKEFDLVRLPREYERQQAQFAIQDGLRTGLSADLLAPEAAPMERAIRERRPLAAVASWVASAAAFLLLAF